MIEQRTLYDRAGGVPFFEALVARFYARVAADPVARDRWLVLMRAAIAELAPPEDVAADLERYIAMAAEAMRNRD